MKIKVLRLADVNIHYVKCYLFPNWWEDSDVSKDGSEFEEGSLDNMPQSMLLDWTPQISDYENFKGQKCFFMKINPDTGQIENWEKGYKMNIYWKVVDEGIYEYIDDNENIIKKFDTDYVPRYLAIEEEGYGDYVIMNVDENGFIQNWSTEDFMNTVTNLLSHNEED